MALQECNLANLSRALVYLLLLIPPNYMIIKIFISIFFKKKKKLKKSKSVSNHRGKHISTSKPLTLLFAVLSLPWLNLNFYATSLLL